MDKLIKQVFVNRRGNGPRKGTEPYDVKLKAKIIKRYLQGDVSFKMFSWKYKIHPGVISRWLRVIKNGTIKELELLYHGANVMTLSVSQRLLI